MNIILFILDYKNKEILSFFPDNSLFLIPIQPKKKYKIIKDFLLFYFKSRFRFEFIQIDNYQDVGSNIANTLLTIKPHLPDNEPFFIYRHDQIINPICPDLQSNYIHVYKQAAIQSYIGICYIHDSSIFWEKLKKIYKEDYSNQDLNESQVFNELSVHYIITNQYDSSEPNNSLLFIEDEAEIKEYIRENRGKIKYSRYFIEKIEINN
jgi:hypothetical protein